MYIGRISIPIYMMNNITLINSCCEVHPYGECVLKKQGIHVWKGRGRLNYGKGSDNSVHCSGMHIHASRDRIYGRSIKGGYLC